MNGRLIGPWRLGDRLGRGGNANVWRVEHLETKQEAALKEINARRVDREPYQRFLTEIAILRTLGGYPGILPVLDDHVPIEPSDTNQPWLVMPVARPLADALADAQLPDIVQAIARIADTLARLQADHGLGHRDIKPKNLYELDGDFVVGDFGLVALPDRSGLTGDGKPLGPVNFIPFEMLNHPATADPFAADVYSLSKTLWVLCCGLPFPPPGHQPASASPHRVADYRPYPKAVLLDELVDRCTLLHPGSRPSMQQVARDLRAWLELQVEESDLDMADVAATVRRRLENEIGQDHRIERWKEAAYGAVRRFDELARPLNDVLKAADPRAEIGVIDRLVDGHLKTFEHFGSPGILFRWTRASTISSGANHRYVLRMGRGLELIESGEMVIRTVIDLGLEGIMQTTMHWVGEERTVSPGSTEQELALHAAVAELGAKLREALSLFAENAPGY